MAQLTCKNLTLGYDNRAIQEDLNFSIDAGDYLCIVGENGSGKSTLMKTLLHLQAPISGSIELGDGLKKNEIGYLPQREQGKDQYAPPSARRSIIAALAPGPRGGGIDGALSSSARRRGYRTALHRLRKTFILN